MRGIGRSAAWGSSLGPTVFVLAWAVGGWMSAQSYDPTRDTISRLAAVGAETRLVMTVGFVVFGSAVAASAPAWRSTVGGQAWKFVAATGVATLAVAATPLDQSELVDRLHLTAAAVGYATLVAVPIAARADLVRAGANTLAGCGVVVALIATVALPLSVTVDRSGLFQRIGLTAVDAWLVAAAAGPLRPTRTD